MKQLVIGAAQTCPTPGDVGRNLSQHLRLIRLGAELGVGVIVFPELSLTGYELELASGLAFSETDARLAPLADASASSGVSLIVGAPVRTAEALYNAALIFQPDGARQLYTKRHLGTFGEDARRDGRLPPPEPSIFQAGEQDPLLALADDLIAVAICSDTGRATHAQKAAQRGATAYVASMFVIPADFADDSTRLEQYAVQHSFVVAMSNFGSDTGGLASAGSSSIWSPDGVLRARMPASGAGLAIATRTENGWRGDVALLDRAS